MQLNLLVLRCKNIETSKNFYEKLGLKFIKEQHGKGAVHYATYVREMVLELYPLKEGFEIEQSRLGFTVDMNVLENMKDDVVSTYEFDGQRVFVVEDADGRKVELVGEDKN
jgi:catechol 2,3-dioxygenase-like lactoylglutathione lyase family enzyme